MILTTLPDVESDLDTLLNDVVERLELAPSLYELVEERYLAVGNWLSQPGSSLAPMLPQIYPQGSFRIGTTVRPFTDGLEYDLDFVCEFGRGLCDNLAPVAVLDRVEARLRESPHYAGLVERKNRCIRLNYRGDFHLDVLPGRPDSDATADPGCILVPDRSAGEWKPSNPRGYGRWFDVRSSAGATRTLKGIEPLPDQTAGAEKTTLQRSVQALKRARDVAYETNPLLDPDCAPASVVLTTLLAESYIGANSTFLALLEGVRAIIRRIDQASGQRLVVRNPSNPDEDFAERWENAPEAYRQFVRWIHDLERQLVDLHTRRSLPSIKVSMSAIFGERVTEDAVRSYSQAFETERASGMQTAAFGTAMLSTASGPAVIPTRRNTFYGD